MTMIARQVMTADPTWVGETDTLQRVAARMWDMRVPCLPVCAENGDLRGVITYRDIHRRVLTDGGDLSTATAASLTRDPWATIGVDDPFDTTWSQGSARHAGMLPVLDGHHLVGVIPHPAVAAWVTRPRADPAAPSGATPSVLGRSLSPPAADGARPATATGRARAAAGEAAVMTTRRHKVVVVGVDGSSSSITAARWAAGEAHRRGQTLHVMHAYRVSLSGFPGYDERSDLDALVRSDGEVLLGRLADDLRRRVHGLDVTTTVERADPRQILVEASKDAGLTVVGDTGKGRRHPGSVTTGVAVQAMSPVAVIPPTPGHPDGPVLLGVGGSAGCHAAIGYAFDEADARGADLVALHAWDDLQLLGVERRPVLGEGELAGQLAGWQVKYPDVTVRRQVVRDRPGSALLRYAQNAPSRPQMIVVGGRGGRSGLTGILLGSTGRSMTSHAPCPVIVVRPDPASDQ